MHKPVNHAGRAQDARADDEPTQFAMRQTQNDVGGNATNAGQRRQNASDTGKSVAGHQGPPVGSFLARTVAATLISAPAICTHAADASGNAFVFSAFPM